jgi:hypothetical protein
MVRARDHQAVTAQARKDARKVQAAWLNYVRKTEALAAITQCGAMWPADPAGPDTVGTRCQLLVHGRDVQHRHRVIGTQATVNW